MATQFSKLKPTKYPGVRRRPDGRYTILARVADGEGKILTRTATLPAGTTLDEAVLARAGLIQQIRQEASEGSILEVPTLGGYAERWIGRRAREGLRRHTLNHYIATLERHILPVLGEVKLDELGPRHVLLWRDEARAKVMANGKPYAAWSINSWFSVLRNILSDATVEFELRRNPCDGVHGVKKPRAPRAQRYLTAPQLQEFLQMAKLDCPQHYAITLVLVMLGLRWSEASGLHTDHLDLDNMELRVEQAHVRHRIHATKNESRKVLPLSPEVAAAIAEHQEYLRVRENPGLEQGILFPTDKGGYRLPSSVSKAWARVSRAMKLEWTVTPHDLRRSYQNLLRLAGAGQVVQQALMGHSSDAMTVHYSHVDMDEKRRAHEGLVSLLHYREKKANEE